MRPPKEKVPIFPIGGRDEMNLIEIPFTLLTNRMQGDVKTIEGPNWVITGSDKFGLPVAIDEEVYVAMMKFTKDYDFQRHEVPFSRYQMISLMGWDNTGKSYHRIRQALDRLAGVYIRADQFWDNRVRQKVSRGFHILESYLLVEGNPGRSNSFNQMNLALSTFTWSKVIFDSFQAGYIKLLDTERYFRLRLPTSRRAYRFLDKRLYQRDSVEIGLYDYAYNHLGLSRNYRYPSKIKEKLNPSFEELITDGLLKSVSYRMKKDGITIVVKKAAPKRIRANKKPEVQDQEMHRQATHFLAQELAKRGVSSNVATALVTRYPTEQIKEKIEVFDWLMKTNSPKVKDSPPGFLRKSIEEDWAPPANFVSKADRKRREKEAEEKRRNREQAQAQQTAEAQKVSEERKRRMEESPYRDVCDKMKEHLRGKMVSQSFSSWIAPVYISSIEDDKVVIDCPSAFALDLLEESYRSTLEEAVAEVQGREAKVELVCEEEGGD